MSHSHSSLASLGAALALASLLTAQTPDARENGDPVATFWASGLTPAAMTAQLSQGWRITDLQIDSTSPWLFTAAMVPNSGSNAIASWWYYGVDGAGVVSALQQNNARLIDVEPYDDGAGNTRFACVMVSNAGANNKGWDWLYDATTASISALVAQNKRIVDLEQYTVGGQTRYACVTINNTGADQRAWWYYYGVSSATISTLTAQNGARVYDLDREGSSYNVVMIGATNQPKTWRYHALTSTQVADNLSQNGARLVDVNRYSSINGIRFDVVMVDNSTAVASRVNSLMRNNTDGVSGLLLKRLGVGELAVIHGSRAHEPAGTLTLLHQLVAMREVQLGGTTLQTNYRTYTNGGPTSCPGNAGAYVDETLSTVLTAMMQSGDTTRTRTIADGVGGFATLNNRALQLGMTSTVVNHHIGCSTPANATTLRDLAIVHDQVHNGYLGDSRRAFQEQQRVDYGPTGYADGAFEAILAAEAAAIGFTAAALDAWKTRFTINWLQGEYALASGFNRSWNAYVTMPALEGGQVVTRAYAVGVFVADASTAAGAAAAARLGAAEIFREELRSSMQSLLGVPLATTTVVGVGCGPNPHYHGGTAPQLARPAFSFSVNHYPLSPLLLAVGFSSTSANGVPLPFDLSLIGALPGCMAYTDLTITSAQIGGYGPEQEWFMMPASVANVGFTYYTQWYSFDALYNQPFKTSNARVNVVGF